MAKPLSMLPSGVAVFVDANVFHLYLRGPAPVQAVCAEFLERIERGEVRGLTSSLVLDELAYKLLLRRVEEMYGANPLEVLRGRPEAASEAADYVEKGLEVIMGIENLEVLPVGGEHLEAMAEYMRAYSLLPRDALHVAVMAAEGCAHIASADSDFDRVSGVTRWTPLEGHCDARVAGGAQRR